MGYLEDIKKQLNKLKPEMIMKFHVRSIGLFGSVVRDDFSLQTSDIDIIVDFIQPVGMEFIDLADYLEKELHRKVDLVSKKGVKPQYYAAIEKEIVYV